MIFTSPRFERSNLALRNLGEIATRANISAIDSGIGIGKGLLTYLHSHCNRYLIIVAPGSA